MQRKTHFSVSYHIHPSMLPPQHPTQPNGSSTPFSTDLHKPPILPLLFFTVSLSNISLLTTSHHFPPWQDIHHSRIPGAIPLACFLSTYDTPVLPHQSDLFHFFRRGFKDKDISFRFMAVSFIAGFVLFYFILSYLVWFDLVLPNYFLFERRSGVPYGRTQESTVISG